MSTKVRVNLREMYPKYYNQDCFVEVDQDVYETMNNMIILMQHIKEK